MMINVRLMDPAQKGFSSSEVIFAEREVRAQSDQTAASFSLAAAQ